jgi:PAS domain S-box-containing protein
MLDPQGHVLTWNAGAERLKGYSADDIIGQHFSRFYPPETLQAGLPARELEVAEATGTFEDEGWRVRKDGTLFWANVVVTALRDRSGTLVGFAKVTRDLTQRRDHEESLRQSEERFRLLVEGVSDYAIFMLDVNGIVASWNAGAQRIKGYAATRSSAATSRPSTRRRAPERVAGARAAGRRRDRPVLRRRLAHPQGRHQLLGRVTITALRDSQRG